jgi:hypothetical protein
MWGTVFASASVSGRKKLDRSCDTFRERIGTTMLALPGVKKPPEATMA